ncbi:Transcription factor, fungi [Penicillium camemberti]|uniref:Transcription factor, fungi n=1 Tax=Penicillium camemberti (strain FM 013) TaxID=1429867 RepID=A0A0G4PPP9_PENC3|nr:Transcription factor, fungi [Penicillium camemberti]
MRMGLTIGLNHNILESQVIDPVERQHRIQIWWTIYIFDRMWGSKMGLPMQILDEDIHVDMPSTISPRWRHEEELSDSDYMTANIKLARIVGETITKLYSRRKYQETFLQRVQKILKALKHWVETLPESLRLNMEDLESSKKPIVSLHMSFNQCVILTTRPTLLHLLMTLSKKSKSRSNTTNNTGGAGTESESEEVSVSQPVLTLSEACIHAARHSHSMILTRWINGSMPTFGYFHAHYLFSSALILAMSSFVPIGSPTDMTGFDSALDLLRSMTENGNLDAAEFYHNLEQVKVCLAAYRDLRRDEGSADVTAGGVAPNTNANASGNARSGAGALALSRPSSDVATATTPFLNALPLNPPTSTPASVSTSIPPASLISTTHDILASATTHPVHSHGIDAYTYPSRDTVSGYTTEMAFLEPTMQDFLAQSDIDLGLLHPVDTFFNEAENLYTCHEF